MDDMLESLRELFARESKQEVSAIDLETPISELGVDSVGFFVVLFELEKRFGITLPDTAAETVKTVGDVVDIVMQQQQAKATL
jgi:acyl carrier protein